MMKDLYYWGLKPVNGDVHITFEYFGENYGSLPEGIHEGDVFDIVETHTGVYTENGKILNKGVRVELPPELLPFYKNQATPHYTTFCDSDSVPKNTALCEWTEMHRKTTKWEVCVYSINAFKQIRDRLVTLLPTAGWLLNDIRNWMDQLDDPVLNEMKIAHPLEWASRHLVEDVRVEDIRNRIADCNWWAYAYDHDYDPDDPFNLAEDWRQEAEKLEQQLADLIDNTRG